MTTVAIGPVLPQNRGALLALLQPVSATFAQVASRISRNKVDPEVPEKCFFVASLLPSQTQNTHALAQRKIGGVVEGLKLTNFDKTQKTGLEEAVANYNATLSGPHEHVHLVYFGS